MATLTQLATSNLALKGAGSDYNFINRFFATKAEADAALADSSWAPVSGRLNACLTGDQGLLVYNASSSALDLADTATRAYVDTKLAALTGDAPALLNTLGEISDALNDDPNFFTTAVAARAANTALINAETSRASAAEAAIQADVNTNEADADTAIAAVQADVDANEAAALTARTAIQADVNQNEADADAAIAAVQADVNQNETDADAAIAAQNTAMLAAVAAVQADVNQNESDADASIAAEKAALLIAIAVVQNDVNTNESDADTAIAAETTARNSAVTAVQTDVDNNEAASIASLALKAPLASPALTGTPTAPTASASTNTTQVATTAYVDTAVGSLLDSAPGALNTLNELAAAIADDANFSTTITNSIAAVQADVNQNEIDGDVATAAVQTDVNAKYLAHANSIAAVQADVNQNEADADAAIAAVQADVDANETTINNALTAAAAANEAHIDNVATLVGVAKDGVNFGAFSGSTISDNLTLKNILQALETKAEAVQTDVDSNESAANTAIATKLNLTGGTLLGSLVVRRDFPDFQLRSNQEKRFIFTDDGGAGTAAIKNVNSSMTFFAGGIAGSNLEMTIATDGVDVSALKIAGAAVTSTSAELNILTGVTADATELNKLDGVTASTANFNLLDGVTATTTEINYIDVAAVGTAEASKALVLDAGKSITGINQLTCVDLTVTGTTTTVDTVTMQATNAIAFEGATADSNEITLTTIDPTADRTIKLPNQSGCVPLLAVDSNTQVTATPEELNKLDGATCTVAEINILTGVTADATELNKLDGATATTTQLNFVTGVTSSIQTQLNAIQADVDQNESDADAAIAANEVHIDNAVTLTGVAKDSAHLATFTGSTISNNVTIKAALQALETKVEAVQTDVDGNESDADTAIAANETHIDNAVTLTGVAKDSTHLATFTGGTIADNQTVKAALQALETKVEAVQTDVDGNESDADTAIALRSLINSPTFTGTPAAPTASAGTNSTQLATTAFVTAAVTGAIDGAPGALDTLNELAAALNDDANFSTTVTNLINANETHIDNAVTLTGVAKDAVNLGTFTGSTVSDSRTIKQAIQELETKAEAVQTDVDGNESDADTAIAANETHIDNMATLTGVAKDATHLATFTGGTIADNQTVKAALQALETKVEAVQTDVDGNESDGDTATAANETHIDNMATLTGVAKDATNIGNFTGSTISDGGTVKAGIQELETAVETKAAVAGPTFTGTPAAPTASASTNTTQIATTAFVTTAVAALDAAALRTLLGIVSAANDAGSGLGSGQMYFNTGTSKYVLVA